MQLHYVGPESPRNGSDLLNRALTEDDNVANVRARGREYLFRNIKSDFARTFGKDGTDVARADLSRISRILDARQSTELDQRFGDSA